MKFKYIIYYKDLLLLPIARLLSLIQIQYYNTVSQRSIEITLPLQHFEACSGTACCNPGYFRTQYFTHSLLSHV